MQHREELDSNKQGFKIGDVFLVEAIIRSAPESERKVGMEIDVTIADEETEALTVFLAISLYFDGDYSQEPSLYVKYGAIIEFLNGIRPEEKYLEFLSHVNFPSYIFPFVREYISNQTMRMGVEPLILPPINFVRIYEEQKKQD